MSKPIVIIYLGIATLGEEPVRRSCVKSMEYLNNGKPDYHWFVLPDYEASRVEFKVFYEKDFTETRFEELKSIIEQSLKK